MEKSMLYDLLDNRLLHEWYDKTKEDDGCGFRQRENELAEELKKELNEKGRELLTSYSIAVENRIEYINYNLSIKILNFGVETGMQLQKAFDEFKENGF